jgi:hypothetical protein
LSTKDQEHLLVLDYLNTKLKQAESDVTTFSLMIEEVISLRKQKNNLNTSNNFLKVVANKED